MKCLLQKHLAACKRDHLSGTTQRVSGAVNRTIPKDLARPEGLEPPTYRFEVVLGTHSQGLGKKRYPILLDFTTFLFFQVPALPVQSGRNVVTIGLAVGGFAYRFTVLRSLKSYGVTTTCKGLRPPCDHSI